MTTRNQRTAVSSAGLAICNIGIAIPWGPESDPFLMVVAGANPLEWLLNILFVILALVLLVGWLRSQRLLQWAAQGSAGVWTMTGWYLWLTSGGNLRDISMGIVCWGIAAMAFSIDYSARISQGEVAYTRALEEEVA
jgi:hypothetical protein